jgi:hypothetical protein
MFLTADAVTASNSIEGFRVSTVEVADLMEGGHDDDHQSRLTLLVRSPQRPHILITENLSEVTDTLGAFPAAEEGDGNDDRRTDPAGPGRR